jgi:hypothetical protein
MRQESIYGGALIGSTAVLLATALTHPTGSRMFASPEALAQVIAINKLAHALAIIGVWLALFGAVGLSRRLGWQRPEVTAGFTAFAFVAIGMLLAPVLDGFVVPQLISGWFDMDEASRSQARRLINFCVTIASAITRVYMFGVAFAIALWSWSAWRQGFSRALPWIGGIVAALGIAAAIGGPPIVSVHELLALVVGQSVWFVWAGVTMLRTPDDVTTR